MRKLIFALATLSTLGGPVAADAEVLADHHIVHGIVFHPRPIHGIIRHRVCAAWEVFGGERHCVRWRVIP